MAIALYRFGDLDVRTIKYLVEPLQATFGNKITIEPQPLALPPSAFYPIREQWLARGLARALADHHQQLQQAGGAVVQCLVLGVADCDLFATGFNHAISHTLEEARCAVLSVARLDDRFYGYPCMDPRRFRARCAAAAIHELGRLSGLGHCKDPECVMWRSETVQEIDNKGWRMCEDCQNAVQRGLVGVAAAGAAPGWQD